MKLYLIEATNGMNWGKFAVGRFDDEWEWSSSLEAAESDRPLLEDLGWHWKDLWVMDLQTGEGARFRPGGNAKHDLDKHQIWVCPLFEPFLRWLYKVKFKDLEELPALVDLANAPFHLHGYRRPGPETAR